MPARVTAFEKRHGPNALQFGCTHLQRAKEKTKYILMPLIAFV